MYKFLIVPLSQMPLAEEFLTEGEMRYYQTLKIEKRKNDFALGRYALKLLIKGHFIDTEYKDIEILKHDDGHPLLSVNGADPGLYISISHSNGVAAVAASSTNKVGIDIEKIEDRSNAWAEMVFTKAELTGYNAAYLTTLWAKKEAVLKLYGLGLSVGMHDVEFVGDEIKLHGKLAGKDSNIKVDVKTDFEDFVTAVVYI
ncbi:phosphopantetheinyl transferase [Elusimicrobium simillimum]|uniref:4'-phosphopantetheinyl transferase family protein n=1 Tax=Elusimicrobium simillimum TaxID=3143438 RepID=UPI003C6EB546